MTRREALIEAARRWGDRASVVEIADAPTAEAKTPRSSRKAAP